MRPSDEEQRVLISSPSRFVGDIEHGDLLITHAWPNASHRVNASIFESPFARDAFVVCFKTASPERPARKAVPDDGHTGEVICDSLSVLFGKRFDNHGSLQNHGAFYIPDFSLFGSPLNRDFVFNSNEIRFDFPVTLDFREIRKLFPILFSHDADAKFIASFRAAAKFYRLALVNSHHDPEVAFLQLITAGEIIAARLFHDQARLDDEAKRILHDVQSRIIGGSKQKFVAMVQILVKEDFFVRDPGEKPYLLLDPGNFETALRSAFDLRSKYIHSGIRFGTWLAPSSAHLNDEVSFGVPAIEDKKLAQVIGHSATFCGLERVIRYCLISSAQQEGLYLM